MISEPCRLPLPVPFSSAAFSANWRRPRFVPAPRPRCAWESEKVRGRSSWTRPPTGRSPLSARGSRVGLKGRGQLARALRSLGRVAGVSGESQESPESCRSLREVAGGPAKSQESPRSHRSLRGVIGVSAESQESPRSRRSLRGVAGASCKRPPAIIWAMLWFHRGAGAPRP